MAFYPKSQIKQNLHTNGGEYILSTTKEEYKGYYYEISSGKRYTGKSPNDTPNILLEPIISPSAIPPNNTIPTITTDTFNVYSVLNKPLPERTIPQYQQTLPTQKDQQLGVFSRYFCKKTNEIKYIEISQSTFGQLQSKSPQIAWDLYTPISTLWYIKGDREKVYTTNKNLIKLIEDSQKWPGFTQYFKEDFSKYFVS
jgi:hypothetical protein